ncbi:MAG: histidine kinase [Sphaerobacter sp.]|nr:histidine kinase [Sphaerobacter sp.]
MRDRSQERAGDAPPPLSLAALLDNLPGMAYRCRNDLSRTMEFVSEGAVALTGYQPADLVGQRAVSYATLIHPADRDRVWRELQTAVRRQERFQVTYRIHTATGEEKWVCERGCGMPGPGGAVAAIEGVITATAGDSRAAHPGEERAAANARELVTLLEIARNVVATVDLEPLLGLILDEVRTAMDYHGAGILILEGEELVQVASRGPDPDRMAEGIRLRLADAPVVRQALQGREPLVIGDVWGDSQIARGYRLGVSEAWLRARPYVRSWVGVPLQFRGRTLGLLVITYGEPNHFTDHHVRLLAAVAAQATVAIENARLVAAAREAAVLDERQRIARDLHDAVTQTLFSASLVGDVLPVLWARNPQRGAEALEDLRVLTRGALAEMRTLLFELRPTALSETPLAELLRHLADAVTGRSRLPVTVTAQDVPPLPTDVQIAFYRIAQEALNNVVKYAQAGQVDVRLRRTPDGTVSLRVHDDGRGFNPDDIPAGHFGMQTMRERATGIGAALTITSAPGRGTDVLVVWPGDHGGTDVLVVWPGDHGGAARDSETEEV